MDDGRHYELEVTNGKDQRGAHDHVGVYDQKDEKNYVGLSVSVL